MKKRENNLVLLVLLIVIALLVFTSVAVMNSFNAMKLTTKASAQGAVQLVVESSAAPTPTPTPTPSISGGSGGGGVSVKRFIIDKKEIITKLKQGGSRIETITITNNGEVLLDFIINVENLQDYAVLSPTSFRLTPGNSKTVSVIFTVSEETNYGVYAGRIIVQGNNIIKAVDVVMDVETKMVLFDLKVDIPEKLKEVMPGGEISAQITIFNIGDLTGLNTTATYKISGIEGTAIAEENETLVIDTQLSFTKSFTLPGDIKAGTYVLSAEIEYNESATVSSDTFYVITEIEFPIRTDYAVYIIVAVVILVFIIIMYLNYRRLKKVEKKHKRLYEKIEEGGKRE